jgi:hypothetical protein
MMKRKPCKKVMLVCLVIFLMLGGISGVFSPLAIAQDKREISRNDVQGKVLLTKINIFLRGVIEVKSDLTDKVYMFYVGMDTVYIPDRFPIVGETIKVTYFNEEGKLKAARVQIIKVLR